MTVSLAVATGVVNALDDRARERLATIQHQQREIAALQRALALTEEQRDVAEARVRAARLLRSWVAEDGQRVILADDLHTALEEAVAR